MSCSCSYGCGSSGGAMSMRAASIENARQQKINDIMHQMNTNGVAFSIRRKEPESPKKDVRAIKFI